MIEQDVPKFAPEGTVVILAKGGPAAKGQISTEPGSGVPLDDVSFAFIAPGHVPLGFASPGHVVLGFVGPDGMIARFAQKATKKALNTKPTGDGKTVIVWQDDPGDLATVTRSVPDPSQAPAFDFKRNGKTPAAGHYEPGTPGFRYWTAVEALRRAGDFWQAIIGTVTWQTGSKLPVLLDVGTDFNAFYDRKALNFFHGETQFGTVYSGESPDIVCHEMGHAVLDAIKPELWGAASLEAAAFHESFADISALLAALQLPEIRSGVLTETAGHLYSSSRLSRLAEQLGAAIRLQNPQAVDSDCLRNAVNSFTYVDPVQLPHMAPASHLSSEPHSLSRLFTGAFFESLAALVSATVADTSAPTEADLERVSRRMAELLVEAVRAAPIVSNYYAQLAGELVGSATASEAAVLRAVFVRRSILSLESSMRVVSLQTGIQHTSAIAAEPRAAAQEPLTMVAIDARHYGLEKPLLLASPAQSRTYEVRASASDASSIEPVSALIAARAFADDIVRRGRVAFSAEAHEKPKLHIPGRFHTHRIVAEGGDALKLERICFDCGLRWA